MRLATFIGAVVVLGVKLLKSMCMTLLFWYVKLPVLTHWPPVLAARTPLVAPAAVVMGAVAEPAVENLISPELTVIRPVPEIIPDKVWMAELL